MKLSDQLHSITSYFRERPVKRAYLFGSYARGDADTSSDIDLLVEIDPSVKVRLGFFAMQHELEDLIETSVDLVTADGLSEYIAPYVEQEKVLIYER